jgi:hypothetical protein
MDYILSMANINKNFPPETTLHDIAQALGESVTDIATVIYTETGMTKPALADFLATIKDTTTLKEVLQ